MLSDKEYCPHEDVQGRRCQLGPAHESACHFGAFRPTSAQAEMLNDIAKVSGTRKLVCQGMSSVATLKALNRKGFIHLRWVASRAWDASLKPAGQRLLQDLPR